MSGRIRAMNEKIATIYNGLPREVKASFWFLVCSFFQRGLAVITTPIFTRMMTASEYGEFSAFYSWYGIITIITTCNLFYGGYVRGLVIYEKNKFSFTSSMQALMLTLVSLWFVVYLLFREQVNQFLELTTFQVVAMFILIWTNGVFTFWASYQRVTLEYRKLTALSILTSATMPVVQLALMQVMDNLVNARILGMVIVGVMFYPVLFVVHMKRGKVFLNKQIWKYALTFNVPLIPHYLSQIVLNSADRIMIKDMIGAEKAGIYSLANSIAQIMTVFSSALMQTVEPWIYKKVNSNEVSDIKKVAYMCFAIIALVNIVLIALAPEAVWFFAPEEYREAVWVIPPVAMGTFFSFTDTFFATFQLYYKKTQYVTLVTVIGAIINIVLNYIFIDIFGYHAAGYTTLICYMLYSFLHYLFMKKTIKTYMGNSNVFNGRIVLLIMIAFVFVGFIMMLSYEHMFIRYICIGAVCCICLIKYRTISEFMKNILEGKR